MTGQAGPQVSSDDKLWTLLTYIFSPIVPVVVLLMEDKKNRPFIKAHNAQALILGLVVWVLWAVLGWTLFLTCVPFAGVIYMIYLGIQAYGGKYVEIPVITKFCKDQGWA